MSMQKVQKSMLCCLWMLILGLLLPCVQNGYGPVQVV